MDDKKKDIEAFMSGLVDEEYLLSGIVPMVTVPSAAIYKLLAERGALEAELAATRKALEEADRALLFWTVNLPHDTAANYTKDQSDKAVEAALQRQSQRGKTGEGAG